MKKDRGSVPHFLRFAQALARVSGIGLPSAALLVAAACGGRTENTTNDAGRHDASGFSVNDGAPLGINCSGPPVESGPCAELGVSVDSSPGDATLLGIEDSGGDEYLGFQPDSEPAPGVDAGIQEAPDSGMPTDAAFDTGVVFFGADSGNLGVQDSGASDGESHSDGPDEASLTGGGPCDFPDLPA